MSAGEAYSEEVRRLFREAPGAGRAAGAGWVAAEAVEPLTGTRVRWQLRGAGGVITEARYQVRGCPHTLAAAALVAAALKGRPITAVGIDFEAIAQRLQAPAAKRGRFFVIQDALREALLLFGAAHA